MAGVRVKVRCSAKTDNELKFMPVFESDSTRNDSNFRFSKGTPEGEIRLTVDDPKVMTQFKVDEEYYVDFIRFV